MPARPRRGKASLVLLIFVAAAAYGAGAATLWLLSAQPDRRTRPQVSGQPADLTGEALVALGRIRPAGGLRPVAGPPGDQIAELLVREGDTVAAGQPIVRLVSRADRKAELDLLDQQIVDARGQNKLAKASGKREIEVSAAKLDEQTRLAPLELKAQEAKLEFLERQRDGADRRLRSMKELQQVSPNTISAQDVDGQDLLLAQTIAELAAGKSLLAKADARATDRQAGCRGTVGCGAEPIWNARSVRFRSSRSRKNGRSPNSNMTAPSCQPRPLDAWSRSPAASATRPPRSNRSSSWPTRPPCSASPKCTKPTWPSCGNG